MATLSPAIVQLTGPLLLGHLFNWGLFGSLVVQTYIYYMAFPNDRWLPKTIVSFAFVVEVLQTVLSTRDAFRIFGSGWGEMETLEEVGWLWFSVPVLGSLIACMEQLFYAWRIWVLSGEKLWLPITITVLSLVQGAAGAWTGIYSHFIGIFSEVPKHARNTAIVWLGGTALCDATITAGMIYYLNRSRTGFRHTNILLTKIIRITIETGLICAALSILDLALFLAFKQNNYHLAPSIALSKLYSNSLLVVLNSRVRTVNGREKQLPTHDISLSVALSPIAFTKSTDPSDSLA